MKKILLVLGLLLLTIFSVNAQEVSNNAIGLRFNQGNGLGADISYQKKMSDKNRLEVNLGLRDEFSSFKGTGLYQWVWNLEDSFNWYAGFGAGYDSEYAALFGAGVIGIEYNFNAPILISIDYRPEVGITGNYDGLGNSFAFAVRYQF
jgi:opacity protein-like surface antigen